jgi:hypothetical protein
VNTGYATHEDASATIGTHERVCAHLRREKSGNL